MARIVFKSFRAINYLRLFHHSLVCANAPECTVSKSASEAEFMALREAAEQ